MAEREIIVVADAEVLAQAAAARLVARINENPGQVAICLTGGSTPKRLYELLATDAWRGQIPWERVQWFMGDDRFVPPDHPDSNIGMAKRAFLDLCAAPGTVHPMPTTLASPDVAARAYETTLRDVFGARIAFDLVLMGIGPDGHTASLFPGDPAIQETERWVVGVPRAPVAPLVPRVTLTFAALAQCREMLFQIDGANKRAIVARTLHDETLPAAQARSNERTVWLIDRAASTETI